MDRESIIEGIARTLFLCAYADGVEEGKIEGDCASMGGDWDDIAPETDPSALRKARELVAEWEERTIDYLEREEKASGIILIEQACELWIKLGGSGSQHYDASERFAHAWAMEALGHGVGLNDDLPSGVKAPEWMHAPDTEFHWFDLESVEFCKLQKTYSLTLKNEEGVILRDYLIGNLEGEWRALDDDVAEVLMLDIQKAIEEEEAR